MIFFLWQWLMSLPAMQVVAGAHCLVLLGTLLNLYREHDPKLSPDTLSRLCVTAAMGCFPVIFSGVYDYWFLTLIFIVVTWGITLREAHDVKACLHNKLKPAVMAQGSQPPQTQSLEEIESVHADLLVPQPPPSRQAKVDKPRRKIRLFGS